MTALANRDPYKIGLIAIAGMLLLGLLVVMLSVIPFGTRTYTAYFEQSANLKPSEDVEISGIRVGEVRSVEISGESVKVTFTVGKDMHLGQDSTADIKVATLLGTHFLQVTPQGAGNLPGDSIALSNTTVPFNLQDALGGATTKVEQLNTKQIATLFTTLSDELAPSNKNLGPALEGVIRLSQVVVNHGEDLGKVITSARALTQQLSAASPDLIALFKQSNLVLAEVTSRRAAIHALLVEATALAKNLIAVVSQTRADVKPALVALNSALGELNRQDKTLRHLLDIMGPAARYVANATGNGPYGLLHLPSPGLPADDTLCTAGSC